MCLESSLWNTASVYEGTTSPSWTCFAPFHIKRVDMPMFLRRGTLNNTGKLITLKDYGGMRQMWDRCLPERSTQMNGSAPAERDGGGSRLRYPSLCLRDVAGA